jgi:pectinesterase
VIENLTIKNTHGVVGPHAFAILGRGDRTIIVDCDVLSEGADTVALWRGDVGRYYHARCNFRGAVDFVCPRGWCYIADSTFFETKATAALWHDGSKNRDQKFVLRNCKFDGVDGWHLARHHHDAAFYLLDCTFAKSMIDRAPYRVVYPISGEPTTQGHIDRNKELDKTNRWGERAYFFNCHRDGGNDYQWHADNLATAEGAPRPQDITAKWTFAATWDPESTTPPTMTKNQRRGDDFVMTFAEPVTVKGNRRNYLSGSGADTLVFRAPPDGTTQIIASQASAKVRVAETVEHRTGD